MTFPTADATTLHFQAISTVDDYVRAADGMARKMGLFPHTFPDAYTKFVAAYIAQAGADYRAAYLSKVAGEFHVLLSSVSDRD